MPLKKPLETEKVGDHPCPKCNANAIVVAERQKPGTMFWMIFVVCDKCKKRSFVGLMDGEEKKRIDRHVKLMDLWKKAKTPRERGRIMAEVRKIGQAKKEWEASL